jgi:RHS repeat-associated protein
VFSNGSWQATTLVDHLVYSAFGALTSQTNASAQPRFTYTGQVLDTLTGLYYYKARWYDPSTGGFISQDPKGFNGGDANLNRYVGNSPVNYVDPSGCFSITIGGQTFVPPWDPRAGGIGQTIGAIGSAGTVIAAGGVAGAAGGAAGGGLTGGIIGGVVGGAATDGVGIGAGVLLGGGRGLVNGAIAGGISGAITGALAPPGATVGSVAWPAAEGGAISGAVAVALGPIIGAIAGKLLGPAVGGGGGLAIAGGGELSQGVAAEVPTLVVNWAPRILGAGVGLMFSQGGSGGPRPVGDDAPGEPPARGLDIQSGKGHSAGGPMSFDDAVAEVRGGGDVVASGRDNARSIAEAAGNGPPQWDPPHGPGQLPHFHPTIDGVRQPGHVAY